MSTDKLCSALKLLGINPNNYKRIFESNADDDQLLDLDEFEMIDPEFDENKWKMIAGDKDEINASTWNDFMTKAFKTCEENTGVFKEMKTRPETYLDLDVETQRKGRIISLAYKNLHLISDKNLRSKTDEALIEMATLIPIGFKGNPEYFEPPICDIARVDLELALRIVKLDRVKLFRKRLCIEIASAVPEVIKDKFKRYQNDYEIVSSAVYNEPKVIQYVGSKLRKNEPKMIKLITMATEEGYSKAIKHFPEHQTNIDFMCKLIQIKPIIYTYLPSKIRLNAKVAATFVNQLEGKKAPKAIHSAPALKDVKEKLCKDIEYLTDFTKHVEKRKNRKEFKNKLLSDYIYNHVKEVFKMHQRGEDLDGFTNLPERFQ